MSIRAGSIALGAAAALAVGGAPAVGDVAVTSSTAPPAAVGLTGAGKVLVSFPVDRPGSTRTIGLVRGLEGDRRLVGIDFRVQDGQLYGVGDAGGIYTLATRGARAHKVSELSVTLEGTRFGVDFNPAANRLRVVSDTGQNLRHDIDDVTAGTTTVDVALTYPPATTTAAGVSAAAYTNNDLDAATSTTLFAVDTALDQVVVQAPANNGTLSATGQLGVDGGSDAGFDIVSTLRGGRTVDQRGYATLRVGGTYRLYEVSLLTGMVSGRGSFPRAVTDLALPTSA